MITASVMGSFNWVSATDLSLARIMAEISSGLKERPDRETFVFSPILRLIDKIVASGAATIWFLAVRPTSMLPLGSIPTQDGMTSSPSTVMISGFCLLMTAISELVVPKSMPTMILIHTSLY